MISSPTEMVRVVEVDALEQANDVFFQQLTEKVGYAIRETTAIPSAVKPAVFHALDQVKQHGIYAITTSDAEARKPLVHLQMILEHVFSVELTGHYNNSNPEGSIEYINGFIYTPNPCTPLCTKGEITANLVHPSIGSNPHLLSTVQGRIVSCRNLLAKGARLYIIYPQGGRSGRTPDQIAVYEEELKNKDYFGPYFDGCNAIPVEGSYLVDCQQNSATMANDHIGALYLMKAPSGKVYAFAIKMPQANSPQEPTQSAVWFGSADHPEVKTRITEILNAIRSDSAAPEFKTFGL